MKSVGEGEQSEVQYDYLKSFRGGDVSCLFLVLLEVYTENRIVLNSICDNSVASKTKGQTNREKSSISILLSLIV